MPPSFDRSSTLITCACAAVALGLVAGCSSSSGSNFADGGGGGGTDATISLDAPDFDMHDTGKLISTGGTPDATDAYYVNDPLPKYCVIDGGTAPPQITGTVECPSDKNLEGCPCSPIGTTAACWPGLRVDRDIGQCKDGTTTCVSSDEGLGSVWSACQGYVLPAMGATAGAAACKCFSSGEWNLANLSPCFIDYGSAGTYAVSSYLVNGTVTCPAQNGTPPPTPEPGVPWSTDTLKVDCAGSFTLCYTIKAGSATSPQPTDCIVGQSCVSGDYLTANAVQPFPPLGGWVNTDPSCAEKFSSGGGYGEMTVKGLSEYCEGIGANDGGTAEVFNRVPYCSLACEMNPSGAGCQNCQTGGSGSFGN